MQEFSDNSSRCWSNGCCLPLLFPTGLRIRKLTGTEPSLERERNICFLPSHLFPFSCSKSYVNKASKEEETRTKDTCMHPPSHIRPIIFWNFHKCVTSFPFWLSMLKFTETNKRHHEVSSRHHLFGQSREAILERAVIPSCWQKIKA